MTVDEHIDILTDSRADAEVVADLLDDADGWTEWTAPFLLGTAWQRCGDPAPGGIGAVRRLGVWAFVIRELITSHVLGRSQRYAMLTPDLVIASFGGITLSRQTDRGTRITWSVEFRPRSGILGLPLAFTPSRVIKNWRRS